MKRIVFAIVAFLTIPNMIMASECSSTDVERLKKMADNVTYYIEPVLLDSGLMTYTAHVSGLSKDLFFEAEPKLLIFFNFSDDYIGESNVPYLFKNSSYNIKIYGREICSYKLFRTITINTPDYNPYYSDPVCEGAENLTICQKWTTNNLTYEEFVKKVQNEKNKQIEKKEEQKEEQKQPNTSKFDFYYYFHKYYWYILSTMIGILALLIYLWIKENNRNKL